MRIITGKLKGRRITIPEGLDVRPTTDRAKESIFNLIEARYYLDNTMILDLFAGSGNLGFEAISRGAKSVTAVEHEAENTKLIEKTAEKLGIKDQIRPVTADVLQYLEGMPLPHHFIFADPPYDYPFLDEMIDLVFEKNWLTEEGWLLLEHDKYKDFSEHSNFTESRAYGRTIVSIFQRQPVDSE